MAPKRRAEGAWCVFLGKTRREWKIGEERQMRETRHERDITEKKRRVRGTARRQKRTR